MENIMNAVNTVISACQDALDDADGALRHASVLACTPFSDSVGEGRCASVDSLRRKRIFDRHNALYWHYIISYKQYDPAG